MKLIVWVMTDRVGSKVEREMEIDDEDFEGMSAEQREQHITTEVEFYISQNGMYEWGWREAK